METEQGGGKGTGEGNALDDSSVPRPGETLPVSIAIDPLSGRVLSHYRLEEPLGAGGMGVLYRATDLKLGRTVAIKLLARHLVSDEAAKARFVREARAASALDHPNIATIHEIGEENGELFIAMSLYEGETLKQRLEKGRVAVDETLNILRQVLLGLEAAHSAGIVHRDIKPANILVTSKGTVKILDFGLAKLISDSQAQTMAAMGQAMGTLLYMSPEQLRGEAVDPRSDLWSLGVLTYELLAGTSPFRTDSNAATVSRILNDEPASLAAVPGIRDWLAGLVSKLLRKNPAERPQTASEVLKRLEDGNLTSTQPRAMRTPSGLRGPRLALVPITIGALAAGLLWYFVIRPGPRHAELDRSVAVLPFSSLSSSPDDAWFADGIHGDLLTQLSKIGDLKVISRTSVMQYRSATRNLREIGEALGVATVLEGTVQRAGNRVRIEARLSDAHNDRQIWAERYDRELTDVFAIQSAVTEEIARALNAKLSPEEKRRIERRPTRSTEAYEFYLRGREYADRPNQRAADFRIAEQMYHRAIETDPDFALAHAGLSNIDTLGFYWYQLDASEARLAEAKAEAERALALDPDLPEAHVAAGWVPWMKRDFPPALKEFELALKSDPNNLVARYSLAAVQRRLGALEDAVRNYERVIQLDPHSHYLEDLAYTLTMLRRYEEAERAFDRVLSWAPDNEVALIDKARMMLSWKGDDRLAKSILSRLPSSVDRSGVLTLNKHLIDLMKLFPRETSAALAPTSIEIFVSRVGVLPRASIEAMAAAMAGDLPRALAQYEKARAQLELELKKDPPQAFRYQVALGRAYAGVGRNVEAVGQARKAVELLPVSKDAVDGPSVLEELAAVHAAVGDADSAIAEIRRLLSIPGYLSAPLLRIDEKWAPLRADPRFRKLAELE